jgi:ATP-dependent DNA ligase
MTFSEFIYFYPEKPILISKDQDLFKKLSDSPDWVAERKYNGSRLELHYLNGKFLWWNRHNQKFSFTPDKELLDILHALPLKGYCVFDGELRNNKVTGIKQKIMLFDTLLWNGELLTTMPFSERRKILSDMVPVDGDPVGIPYQFQTNFDSAFTEVSQDKEIEGLVMKKLSGKIGVSRKSNQDSKWMYKVRRAHEGGNYKF